MIERRRMGEREGDCERRETEGCRVKEGRRKEWEEGEGKRKRKRMKKGGKWGRSKKGGRGKRELQSGGKKREKKVKGVRRGKGERRERGNAIALLLCNITRPTP